MTDNREQEIRASYQPTDYLSRTDPRVYVGELLKTLDESRDVVATWEIQHDEMRREMDFIKQERDEARATIARLEQDRACLVAPEELRQWRDRAESAEARLYDVEDERDTARRETQDNIRCAVETRVRLRAVVEMLEKATQFRNVSWMHAEEDLETDSVGITMEWIRASDVAAALRLAEGPANTDQDALRQFERQEGS